MPEAIHNIESLLQDTFDALVYMHAHHCAEGTVPASHNTGSRPDICYACAAIAEAGVFLAENNKAD